jgi:hypothetical protein
MYPNKIQESANSMNKRLFLQKSIIIGIILLLLPLGWSGKALAADTFSRLNVSTNEVTMEVGDTFALTATAIFLSGAKEDVTSRTDWTTLKKEIATVNNGTLSAKAEGTTTITGTYLEETVTVDVKVSKKVQSLTKDKSNISIRVGELNSEQVKLHATYTDNSADDVESIAQWSSSNDSIANVVSGKITGVSSGSATITAKYGSQTVTILVDVDKVLRLNFELADISLTDLNLRVGTESQIQLRALFDNGESELITTKATWSSNADNIAYAYKGLIKTYDSGEATITASYGSKTVNIAVNVDVTKRLVADPTDAFIHLSTNPRKSIDLKAFYADGDSDTVTTKAKWESDNNEVATVKNGVVTAFSNGTALISASYGGKTTSIAIDVDVARKLDLDSTTMQLSASGVDTKKTAKLEATYADGTVEDVTYRAEWSSDNEAVVYVSKGEVKAISTGQAVVTAQFGNNSVKLVVNVDVAKNLTLNKTNLSLRTGTSETLILSATLADGKTIPVTDKATWTSDNDAVAYVTNGVITAVSSGQAVITAKYGDKIATIMTQVEIPSRLEVNQTDIFMQISDKQALNLLAYFSASNEPVDITKQAAWTSSNEAIAYVSEGNITAIAMGQITIVAKYGGKSVSITVDVATPRRLSVDKPNIEMRANTQQLTVLTATYASGISYEVTDTAVWSSDNSDVASVIKGKISGYKIGHATITAVYGGKTVTISVNVDQSGLLSASKTTVQLQAGTTEQIKVFASYGGGTPEDITEKAEWKSNSPAIAEVKGGLINAIDTGETKITATYGDRTVTITVMVGIVSALELSQSTVLMKEGESITVKAMATFKDATNTKNDVSGDAVWTSSNDKIAKANAGVIKSYISGKATITVKYRGQTETINVEVNIASKLSINSKQVVLPKNSSVKLKLTATYGDRSPEDVTNLAVWKSSSDRIADVEDGLITSYGTNGKVTVTATYAGKSTTVPVEINVATKISLNKKEVVLKSGAEQNLILTAEFSDGSKKDVTDDADWITSSYKVADIDSGNVKASSFGKATITAKYGGKSTSVKVTVDELKYLKINEKNLILAIKGTKQVHANATYKDNSDGDVSVEAIWSSSNDQVVDIKDGLIVAYGVGKARITCKFAGKIVSIQVEVK